MKIILWTLLLLITAKKAVCAGKLDILRLNENNAATLQPLLQKVAEQNKYVAVTLVYDSTEMFGSSINQLLKGNVFKEQSIQQAVINMKNFKNQCKPQGFLPQKTLNVIFLGSLSHVQLERIARIFEGKRNLHTIFILNRKCTAENLQNIFEWIWLRQFVASVLLCNSQLYGFEPYPELDIKHLDINSKNNAVFADKLNLTMKGYQLQLPNYRDFPRTYWLRHATTGKYEMEGSAGRFFAEFLKHYNITFSILNKENAEINTKELFDSLQRKEIEIVPFLIINNNNSRVRGSYYLKTQHICLIFNNKSFKKNNAMTLLRPFKRYIWLSCGVFLILTALLTNLLKLTRANGEKKSMGSIMGLMQALSIILSMPLAMNTQLHKRLIFSLKLETLTAVFVVTISGYVLSQAYLGSLAAFLVSQPLKMPQDIVQTIIQNNQTILTSRNVTSLISTRFEDRRELLHRVKVVSSEVLQQYYDPQYTNYVFLETFDYWCYLEEKFRRRKFLNFYFSKICLGAYPFQYYTEHDSHLYEPLKKFTIATYESGLLNYWMRNNIALSKQLHILQYDPNESSGPTDFRPLALSDVSVIFFVCSCGLTLATVVFLMELLVYKLRKRS